MSEESLKYPRIKAQHTYESVKLARKRLVEGKYLEAVTICVKNNKALLFGKRNDNGKYTMPGGKAESSESIYQSAIRELFEESGLDANELSYIGNQYNSDGVLVHCFEYDITGTEVDRRQVTTKYDPDMEIEEWFWITPGTQAWNKVLTNLQHPKNVALNLLGYV